MKTEELNDMTLYKTKLKLVPKISDELPTGMEINKNATWIVTGFPTMVNNTRLTLVDVVETMGDREGWSGIWSHALRDEEMLKYFEVVRPERLTGFKLVTSNEKKLNEYRSFNLPDVIIEKGDDLREVDADPLTVILHKAKDAGPNFIVEDVSLDIEGEDVGANIKWLSSKMDQYLGKRAVWRVMIGVNDGKTIRVYEGTINGKIALDESPDAALHAFGFDGYFKPLGCKKSLLQLAKDGEKDPYSSRKMAAERMIADEYCKKINIADLPKWEGEYQNE